MILVAAMRKLAGRVTARSFSPRMITRRPATIVEIPDQDLGD
jgi:hypothetical protein